MKYSNFIYLVRILTSKQWNPFSSEVRLSRKRAYWKIFSSPGINRRAEEMNARRNFQEKCPMLQISLTWGEMPLLLYHCHLRSPSARTSTWLQMMVLLAPDSSAPWTQSYSHCPQSWKSASTSISPASKMEAHCKFISFQLSSESRSSVVFKNFFKS